MLIERLSNAEILPYEKGDLFRWVKCLNCDTPLPVRQLVSRVCECGHRTMQYGAFVVSAPIAHQTLMRYAKDRLKPCLMLE